jgi:hypothetical protein
MRHLCTKLIVTILLAVSAGRGDTLELRNGKIVNGTYVKADGDSLWIDVGGSISAFSIKDISKLTLRPDPPVILKSRDLTTIDQLPNPSPSRIGGNVITVPAGTLIAVRLIDAIEPRGSNIGRTFQATISEPVIAMNQTVIAKGSGALVKLVVDTRSMLGSKTLTLDLVAVRPNISMLFLNASRAQKGTSKVRARLADFGVVASIVMGAMAGARSGGLIGAGVGVVAAVGFEAVAPLLKKKKTIPAETLLYFVLQSPITW